MSESGLCGVGSLSVVFSLISISGGVVGACFWTHLAHFYFSSISGGVMLLASGILCLRIADVKNQYMSEINLACSVCTLCLPGLVYMLCCHVYTFMDFLSTVTQTEFSRPLAVVMDSKAPRLASIDRTPLIAVATIDITLLMSVIILLLNTAISVARLRTLAMDKEADNLLWNRYSSGHDSCGNTDGNEGITNPGYETSYAGCLNSDNNHHQHHIPRPAVNQRVEKHTQVYPPGVRTVYSEDRMYM